ncbi:DNA alkylation repair protein [Lentisphaera marina]|uniref:DNA alkylation repair protein n=1 Tax=Lentisphaera marina TaxID=1111041 RepID=UPI002366FB49|nr:DNA alkylation repair protein [Lentisphaera marina]MDD7984967.1 DNA alkylation repair protein [Lentisphaera marina]
MPELLKDSYNKCFLEKLAKNIKNESSNFNQRVFVNHCLNEPWLDLSLKERMKKISYALNSCISGDFVYKACLLTKVSSQFNGYTACLFPDFIEEFGIDNYEQSISSLEVMTKYSSSEFAVRPFLEKYPIKMMQQMIAWSQNSNEHIRRLASEGCRPRLPWGKALNNFKSDPKPILEVLNHLKDDPSEYVRRSVANNLNDIGKDHPEILKDFVAKNLGHISSDCDKMLKHASRNLLKSSDKDILKLFSYPSVQHLKLGMLNLSKNVIWGGELFFEFQVTSKTTIGLLRIEYEIEHLKMNGKYHSKVFKISENNIDKNTKSIKRKHSFQKRSVRKYYPGIHRLHIKLNGERVKSASFNLLASDQS